MFRKTLLHGVLAAVLLLMGAQAASAKIRYTYAVKFVCGFNPDNIGYAGDALDKRAGEPTVKFGNYATDVNIHNFNIYGNPDLNPPVVEKRVKVLVDRGVPVGREPRIVGTSGGDLITLPYGDSTMDDCNRIAEMLWGGVPTPYPLTIGFLIVGSTVELDVTAVYTAQTCANWLYSPIRLECLSSDGRPSDGSVSIDVNQITGHKIAE